MIVYLNNYKGFSDTFIPLKTVNFLVGENSTGKSTVLSILEVLSKMSFWNNPQLSSGEYNIGPFYEIVNQLSKDRSFFQIGAEFESKDPFLPKSNRRLIRILDTFVEREGGIAVDSIRFCVGEDTYYCSHLIDNKIEISKRKKRFSSFEDWVHAKPSSRNKKIDNTLGRYIWITDLMKRAKDCFAGSDNSSCPFINPDELSKFLVLSPIRAEAHRIYESFAKSYSPQGEHIPLLLNKLIHSNSLSNKVAINRLCAFGRNSNLFDSISTPRYGNSSNSPFFVSVEYGKVKTNLTSVGFGVSQSLPLVVEILNSTNCAFSIQQPEVHLHPKAQAAFGDFLYDSVVKNHNSFFCETHSDFIINRFRYALNKGNEKIESQVLFFTRDEKGTHVFPIPIDDEGHYQVVPEDFMSFFIDEELKMLEF